MDNQSAIDRVHDAVQFERDRDTNPPAFLGEIKDGLIWPTTMWPIDLSIIESLPPELIPSHDRLQNLDYPWELLKLIMETISEKVKGLRIAEDVVIPEMVDIRGDVWIEKGVKVYPFTEIVGPVYIGENCIIGNYGQIRESLIGNGSLLGERTSIVRSFIGKNTTFHINYIGDSLIADDVEMGGGCKTANLRLDRNPVISVINGSKIDTQLPKLGAIIGKNVKFGANCLTMPGVKIGEECIIGPQVQILEDVPDHSRIKLIQQLLVKETR